MFDVILHLSRGILIGMCMVGIVMTAVWIWYEIKGVIDENKRSKGP